MLSFGKPSTIVDLSGVTPKVLRVGAYPVDRLSEDYLPSLIAELKHVNDNSNSPRRYNE